jgi:universal stress protein A
MFAPKRIMVPTDFTGDSDKALKEAVAIAETSHSKVFLVHVDPPFSGVGGDYALGSEEIAVVEEADIRVAREKMLDEVKKVTGKTDIEIEVAERHGRTHEEILAYGAEKEIDLIVIEPHAKTGRLKGLVGGVMDKLIHAATCPVLVLH